MDKTQFKIIDEKLSKIMKLLAINLFKNDDKMIKEQSLILHNYSFRPSEIAELLGKPLNTITSYISKSKKKKR